ncbi:MAG: tetratricopeptide repeat protein [Anaerolineae bacterium]|nr:tetratricopeptide repeat protein [Anaerolineae bacterium]
MARLDIALLGRFAVCLDGRPVTGFRSDKARALLAWLVMDSRRPHRREALAGLLWPDYPERNALRSLSTALANVRQALHDAETDPPWLLIDRQSVQFNLRSDHFLDVAVLHSLPALWPDGAVDPNIASELERALRLYRGELLQGFSFADCADLENWLSLQRERYRLRALYVCHRLADYALANHDYAHAEDYAQRGLQLDPWDERVHRALITALAMQGRRAAAVAQYEACQQVLATELGIEPESATTALCEVIRRGDLPTAPETGPTWRHLGIPADRVDNLLPRPLHQLPAPPADLYGREAELLQLVEAVERDGVSLVALRGLGGIGKTALGLALAHRLAPRFPDAQIYLNLRGTEAQPLAPVEAMRQVIRSFYPLADIPERIDDVCAIYQSLLWGKRALLLLDDARDAAQVEPLIVGEGCLLLITSRWRLALPGMRALDLRSLRPDAAADMLRSVAAHLTGEEAGQIALTCGGLPLGLRVVGSAFAERADLMVSDFLAEFSATRKGLPGVMAPVQASLACSADLLDPTLRSRWHALSVFRSSFDRAAVAAIWGLEADEGQGVASNISDAAEAMTRLLRSNLVEYDTASRRYRLHDLCRAHGASRLDEAVERLVQVRHAAHYGDIAQAAYRAFRRGGAEALAALRLFDRERPNIEVGQRWAAGHAPSDDQAARICCTYLDEDFTFLQLRLSGSERMSWWQAGLAAALRLQDPRAEVVSRLGFGVELAFACELPRALAHLAPALQLARDLRDLRAEGLALGLMGKAYERAGQMERAVALYSEWLEVCRELGDRRRERIALNGLGTVHVTIGEPQSAIAYQQRSLEIARQIGDPRGETIARGDLGEALLASGDLDGARTCFEEQLSIAREIGYRTQEAEAHCGLAEISRRQGQDARAWAYYQRAGDLYSAFGSHPDAALDLWNWSMELTRRGDLARAIACAERALTTYVALDHPAAGDMQRQLGSWRCQAA